MRIITLTPTLANTLTIENELVLGVTFQPVPSVQVQDGEIKDIWGNKGAVLHGTLFMKRIDGKVWKSQAFPISSLQAIESKVESFLEKIAEPAIS